MNAAGKVGVVLALVSAIALVVAEKQRPAGAEPDLMHLARQANVAHDPVPLSYAPSQAGLPRLVAIGAGECIPCKAMAPIRAELREEYRGRMVMDFYDVWKDPSAAHHFGTRVIPTLIYFDATGRELGRREGFVPKTEILTAWQRWGVSLAPVPKG
jgi:thioredoxin 1